MIYNKNSDSKRITTAEIASRPPPFGIKWSLTK
nr:MAG TPA: hypothetical protein [Caudoviricetes sp.]